MMRPAEVHRGIKRWTRGGRRTLTIIVTVFAMVVTMFAAGSPATADEDDPPPATGTIYYGEKELTVLSSTITTSTIKADKVADQCSPLSSSQQFCLGSADPDRVITITGYGSVNPGALSPIEAEAVDFLSALYDVPNDGRLLTYGKPELRAYAANRLMSIVTKEAYGETLTPVESKALQWLNSRLITQQRVLAENARAEWETYTAAPCLYVPPTPPSWVTDPLRLPGDVVTYCHVHPGTASWMLPPMPAVDAFRTWGMYRAAEDSGLQYADPSRSLSPAELSAYISMAGTAGAFGIGGLSYGLARVSITVAQAAVNAFLLAGEILHPATWEVPFLWVDLALQTAGAVALAGAVTAVITAVLNIALFAWQAAKNMEVGPALAQSVAEARSMTDPLGLEALKVANAGKTFPAGSTPYLAAGLPMQVLPMMNTEIAAGDTPTALWAGSAHTANDLRFNVAGSAVDQISVPKSDGTRSTVWFSKRWMVEQRHNADGSDNGAPRAVLALQYVNREGFLDIAYRDGDEFQISTVDPDDQQEMSQRHGPLANTLADGTEVDVSVAPKAAPDLGGPRPSASGAMFPGAVVNLRPNPVDVNGDFVGLDSFVDGYTYTWSVESLEGTGWVSVPIQPYAQGSNASYGARFTPSKAGLYSAIVVMAPTSDPSATVTGAIQFRIAEPTPALSDVHLVDSGGGNVSLAFSARLRTPQERQLRIKVQWPGDLLTPGPGPTTTVDVTCHQVDAFNCQTAVAGTPEFGTALNGTVTPTTRLRDGVTLKVTDLNARYSGDATATAEAQFDSALRPSFGAPPAAPSGQVGSVQFDPYLSTVTVPVGVDGNNPNFDIATIVPGSAGATTVSIVNPATSATPVALDLFAGTPRAGRYLASVTQQGGHWVLGLYARPTLDDVGTDTVPLTIQQDDGKRATLFVTINSVVAPDELFRGGVTSDIDPLAIGVTSLPEITPVITGGNSEWGAYSGDFCVRLTDEGGPQQKCAPVTEMVGDEDNPIAFPYEELFPHGIPRGMHTASAWLPTGSDHGWDEPIAATFSLKSNPPNVSGLSWDGERLHATIEPGLDREAWEDNPVSTPIVSVSCTLDDEVLDHCFDSEGGELTVDPGSGTHTLRVKALDQADNYDIETLRFTIGSPEPVLESITVTPATAQVSVGGTRTFTATGHYDDGSEAAVVQGLAWTSSDEAVATINTTGLATAVSAGSTTITATVGAVSGTATLTVTTIPEPDPVLETIVVEPPTSRIAVGGKQTFAATGHYADGSSHKLTSGVVWSSSNASVATVNPTTGVVTGKAVGTAVISGKVAGHTGTANVAVVAAPLPLKVVPTTWVKKWPVKAGRPKKATVGKAVRVASLKLTALGKTKKPTVTYHWFAGGQPIVGATKRKLQVTRAYAGKAITLVVTVSRSGFTKRTKTIGFGKAK